MTNKELNAEIKKTLKANGYNTKDFSVSVRDSLYDTTIKVVVNSPTINRAEVEKILLPYESIDRDERTFEILSGANYYLFVTYKYNVFSEVASDYLGMAQELMKCTEECYTIADGLYLINKGNQRILIQQTPKTQHISYHTSTKEELAEMLYKFITFKTIAA